MIRERDYKRGEETKRWIGKNNGTIGKKYRQRKRRTEVNMWLKGSVDS